MDFLCEMCDCEIIENKSDFENDITTLRKRNDRSLYSNCTINNINLDVFDKIINVFISTHNKNIDFYLINCDIKTEFDNNFMANIKINYHFNTDTNNIKSYLLYYIDSCKSGRFKFSNINQMTINTISDRCNMTDENYINQPMSMVERRLNMIIANNPHLINPLGRNKNHPLIRKYSYIPFNN